MNKVRDGCIKANSWQDNEEKMRLDTRSNTGTKKGLWQTRGPCFYHQSHPQLGIVFALAPSLHFSGVISPLISNMLLISSSILGTHYPGEFIFQCLIFLPFHTVHEVLRARILKWFDIPLSSGPCFVRPLHHDLAILGGPTWHGLVSLS